MLKRFQMLCAKRPVLRQMGVFLWHVLQAHIHAVQLCFVSLLLVLLLAFGLFWRLSEGPITLNALVPPLEDGLQSELGANLGGNFGGNFGANFGGNGSAGNHILAKIGAVGLEKTHHGLALTLYKVVLSNSDGQTLLEAPKAEIALDMLALLRLQFQPKRLDFIGLQLNVTISDTGALSLNTGTPSNAVNAVPTLVLPEPTPVDVRAQAPSTPELAAVNTLLHSLLDTLDKKGRAQKGTIGSLEHIGIFEGSLVVNNSAHQPILAYDALTLGFEKNRSALLNQNQVSLKFQGFGTRGLWTLQARAQNLDNGNRGLDIAMRNFDIDDGMVLLGLDTLPLDIAGGLNTTLSLAFAPDGKVASASGLLAVSDGYYRLQDKDSEPFLFKSAGLNLDYDPSARVIYLSQGSFDAGRTQLAFTGTLNAPALREANASQLQQEPNWHLRVATQTFESGQEWADDEPLSINSFRLDATYLMQQKSLHLDALSLKAPTLNANFNGVLNFSDQGPTANGVLQIKDTSAKSLRHIWPSFINGDLRNWYCQNIKDGTIDNVTLRLNFKPEAFVAAIDHTAMPDEAITAQFAVAHGTLQITNTMPWLVNIAAQGSITGRHAHIDLPQAAMVASSGKLLQFTQASFHIEDTAPRALIPTLIKGEAHSSVETVSDILSREAFRPYFIAAFAKSTVHGDVDGTLSITLPIGDAATPQMTEFTTEATITNLSIDHLLGKEKFDGGTLALSADKNGMSAHGEGHFLGTTGDIYLDKAPESDGKLTFDMALDDMQRVKLGLDFGQGIVGTSAMHLTASLAKADISDAHVEVDLTKTALNNPLPGLVKQSGKPGKLAFDIGARPKGGVILSKLAADFGTVSARGQMEIDETGKIAAIKLSPLRFAMSDDVHLDGGQTDEVLKLILRGQSFDARGFIKSFATGNNRGHALQALDVDCTLATVMGFADQSLTDLNLHYSRRNGDIAALRVSAKLAGKPILVNLLDGEGPARVHVVSQNAGGVLDFLDLYHHMSAGDLDLTLRNADTRIAGDVVIRDFTLTNEPIMKSLASQSGTGGLNAAGDNHVGTNDAGNLAANFDANAVFFNRLQAQFFRQGGRVDIANTAISGAQIGATLQGHIDYAKNDMDMNGALVPAFAVNNFFSRIPLFGPILGGERQEGLFAVNYRLTGKASSPNLQVNPLSAITPGVLRKIMGVVDGTSPLRAPLPDIGGVKTE